MNLVLKNKIKISNNISFFATLIFFVYLLVDLIRLFNIIPLYIGNILYVMIGSFSFLYVFLKKGIKKQLPIILFIVMYNFFGGLGIIINGNIDFPELFWPFGFIGIATLLLNYRISYTVSKYIYIFLLVFLFINIMINGEVNNLNIISSRNTISIMILLYFGVYALTCYVHQKKISFFLLLAGFLVVIMAVGRSGILTFSLLTLLFLIFDFKGTVHKIRSIPKTLMLLLLISILIFILSNVYDDYINNALYNFDRRGLESIRTQIWSDYIGKTISSGNNLLFGAPIEGTIMLDMFQNLHNSWLILHSKYGIIIFIVMGILVLKSIYYYLKSKNYLYFSLLLAILFRMQFDHTNFNAQLDILYFYLILYPLMPIKNKSLSITPIIKESRHEI